MRQPRLHQVDWQVPGNKEKSPRCVGGFAQTGGRHRSYIRFLLPANQRTPSSRATSGTAADALAAWSAMSLQLHKERFPFTDNLMALPFAVFADLTENRRERMTTTVSIRGYRVQTYTFELVRDSLVELLFAPR